MNSLGLRRRIRGIPRHDPDSMCPSSVSQDGPRPTLHPRRAVRTSKRGSSIMLKPGCSRGGPFRNRRTRRGPHRPALERLEDRTLLSPFTVGGPGVNPADFRITTFASGLDYPNGMLTLSDGSLLVGVSNPVAGSSSYYNSSGELLRFTDTNGDGVADNPSGEVLYNGLPGQVTALHQAGEFILATSSLPGSERISVLRVGATPSDPLILVGSINFNF